MEKFIRGVNIFAINVLIAFFLFLGFAGEGEKIKTTRVKKLKTFRSCKELYKTLEGFAKKNTFFFPAFGMINESDFTGAIPRSFSIRTSSLDSTSEVKPNTRYFKTQNIKYSKTNVQVENVDEADIVKTDGSFIYIVSNERVAILKVFPPEEAKIASIIPFDDERLLELFVDKDRLVVLSVAYNYDNYVTLKERNIKYYRYSYTKSYLIVRIYDISDRTKPKLVRKVEFEGNYTSSRKIGSFVYLILNYYPHYQYFYRQGNPSYLLAKESSVPRIGDAISGKSVKTERIARCRKIKYIEPVRTPNFLIIASISLDNPEFKVEREVVLGASETIYASLNNIYVANNFYDREGDGNYENKTLIYKFSVKDGHIYYKASGEVPGRPINQFAMDENGEYFRIATQSYNNGIVASNVYILNNSLNIVGKLENLARTENMHSARFINNRLYLVTFKKIDPLFVIDLAEPENPKVLGELKIPGYSDYLHPLDDNHLIGIGKDTQDMGNFAWYQGLKLALFDVTDPNNPKEKFVEIIGDRGTETPVLTDHRAFLFDREKNLLVLPLTLAEIPAEQKRAGNSSAYGQVTFVGAYVYNLTQQEGFKLKGKISHYEEGSFYKKRYAYYYSNSSFAIKRSLYIDNILYTISNKKVYGNKLSDLEKVVEIGF